MPTSFYNQVVSAVVAVAGPEKGPGIVERQLQSKDISPDGFGPSQFGLVYMSICYATKLYCADPVKRTNFEAKLKAMGG
jgi:hypothetical protein